MKDVLTKWRRVREFEIVALAYECCRILQGRLPPKLKDLGCFTISCTVWDTYDRRALCDLDMSINIMPLSILNKIENEVARHTIITIQLLDKIICYP